MSEIHNANRLYGEEALNLWSPDVKQQYGDTCAIKSQQLILKDFGIECTEDSLVQEAIDNGWYSEGAGTLTPDIGNLLESHNVPCTRMEGANIFNLTNELAQGHKVIVGVDSGELWKDESVFRKLWEWLEEFFGHEVPDHALIVAGIDTSDPNNVQVILTDPGRGDLCKSYPLDQFMDAWSDSNCYMVSTDIAVPSTAAGMANFDQAIGHLNNVAGVPWNQFEVFNDMSYGIPTFYSDGNMMCNPMKSFTNAFFDYAHMGVPIGGNMQFSQLFNPAVYDFNNYMNMGAVMPHFQSNIDMGMAQFQMMDSMNSFMAEAPMFGNGIPMPTNDMYDMFYQHTFDDMVEMGNMGCADFCQQQTMYIECCNAFDTNYQMFF